MRRSTQEQLENLSNRGRGGFSLRDACSQGMSPRTIYRLCDEGQIERLSRGVYRLAGDDDAAPDYAALAIRVPHGVLCTVSALYHYELTTEIPRQIHLAIARNRSVPRIDYPSVRFYRMSDSSFCVGIQQRKINGVMMNVFSPEKTLADCFKYRHELGMDLAIESLKKYLEWADANPSDVLLMARSCRVEKIIKPYLEALV